MVYEHNKHILQYTHMVSGNSFSFLYSVFLFANPGLMVNQGHSHEHSFSCTFCMKLDSLETTYCSSLWPFLQCFLKATENGGTFLQTQELQIQVTFRMTVTSSVHRTSLPEALLLTAGSHLNLLTELAILEDGGRKQLCYISCWQFYAGCHSWWTAEFTFSSFPPLLFLYLCSWVQCWQMYHPSIQAWVSFSKWTRGIFSHSY